MIVKLKPRLQKTVDYLRDKLKQIRTGRANTAIVENIKVEIYDSQMPISQLATISVPDARTILVAPWDKTVLEPIEKALQKADIGGTPSVGEDSIRISLPEMSEERRKELVKVVKAEVEKARISVRNIRKEFIQDVDQKAQDGVLPEDAKDRIRKEIDDMVKEFNGQIEEIGEKKESEIMTI